MEQPLQEFVDSQGQRLRIDVERGALRGVKLLGLTSKNGRTYRESALKDASTLYEGAKVNVNHPKGSPHAPRDYQDRLGAVRDVVYREGVGLFADLHFNPKHALAQQLAWDAAHAPEQVGLSHNVLARTSRSGETTVVEAITKVESVDLVADPATTRGLFEQSEGQLESLVEQLASARSKIAALERRIRVLQLLAEHELRLPGSRDTERAVSPAFMNMLLAAASEEALEALVADRATLVSRSQAPTTVVAREQQYLPTTEQPRMQSAKEFAASLRR